MDPTSKILPPPHAHIIIGRIRENLEALTTSMDSLMELELEGDSSTVLTQLELIKVGLHNSLNQITVKIAAIRNQLVASTASTYLQADVVLEIDNIQCLEPRGRYTLVLTNDLMILRGKQSLMSVPVHAISQMALLPSHQSSKKDGEDYLAMHFAESIKLIGNKDSKSMLVNLSRCFNPSARSKYSDSATDFLESTLIMMALHDITNISIMRPQKELFNSVRESKPFIRCHHGVQEGAIYPLHDGLVFIRPLLMIPAHRISSIAAGRGGSAGNTRYVDLILETVDDQKYAFTNIDREELPSLQAYVKGHLEECARKSRTANTRDIDVDKATQQNTADASESDDDYSDEDYDPDDVDSDVCDECEQSSDGEKPLEAASQSQLNRNKQKRYTVQVIERARKTVRVTGGKVSVA